MSADSSTGKPAPDALRWRTMWACVALAAMTLIVFGQTVTHEFINFDDDDYVVNNPIVNGGLTVRGVAAAFTRAHAANWHPLTWISHALDYQLYGLNPAGHHLSNVLIHTATVVALFLVLRRMTGAFWKSAFVAAVFAIHPLRVESVAWVAERKDVLSGLFFVLTLGAYASYARGPRSPGRYGLVLLLMALGLLCKPMLVTLPIVLLLLDYWPLSRPEPFAKLALEKLPFFALSAISCVVTLLAQSKAIKSAEVLSLPMRLINAVLSLKTYLQQMIYPAGLGLFYPFPHTLSPWDAVEIGLVIALISAIAWRQRGPRPWLLVGWAWYLVMLLPVLGIVQVGSQSHADRYTYLPQIGIYIALTWLAAEWSAKRGWRENVVGPVMGAVVLALMACAWRQAGYWQNSETIWSHTLDCTADNTLAYMNLGHELLRKGQLKEAYALYQKGLQAEPNNPEFHNNLGNVLRQQGKADEAVTQYEEAVQCDPRFVEARYNLGKIYLQVRRTNDAIVEFQKTIQIAPNFALALTSLGNALIQQGKTDEAIAPFERALEIAPADANVHLNLAYCLLQAGRMNEALTHNRKALELKPNDPGTENNLAWLLATCPEAALRNGNEAVSLAQEASTQTGGQNPMVLHTLAAALAEMGHFPEALATAQRASQLAQSKSMVKLSEELQLEMTAYQAGKPYHLPPHSL